MKNYFVRYQYSYRAKNIYDDYELVETVESDIISMSESFTLHEVQCKIASDNFLARAGIDPHDIDIITMNSL